MYYLKLFLLSIIFIVSNLIPFNEGTNLFSLNKLIGIDFFAGLNPVQLSFIKYFVLLVCLIIVLIPKIKEIIIGAVDYFKSRDNNNLINYKILLISFFSVVSYYLFYYIFEKTIFLFFKDKYINLLVGNLSSLIIFILIYFRNKNKLKIEKISFIKGFEIGFLAALLSYFSISIFGSIIFVLLLSRYKTNESVLYSSIILFFFSAVKVYISFHKMNFNIMPLLNINNITFLLFSFFIFVILLQKLPLLYKKASVEIIVLSLILFNVIFFFFII